MYPPNISTGTESSGEIELFYKIKNDPITINWIVLHSLDIAKHKRQRTGEVDFLIIIPNKGVLCLEIKAIKSIKRENGIWCLGPGKSEIRGPFKQASTNMYSIQESLWNIDKNLKKIVFEYVVVFPYLKFELESQEWQSWQVVDSEDLGNKSIGQLLLIKIDEARSHIMKTPSSTWFNPLSPEPTSDQVNRIVQLLRPTFEFFESPESRAGRRNAELKTYTQEQFDALDATSLNPRVIFLGPAGTGKSLLAIELARRKANEGKKVLLICYNRLLGEWLKKETDYLKPQVKTNTIHSHMLDVAGLSPEGGDNDFWQERLPNAALSVLSSDVDYKHRFDVIIIDEVQDILSPINLSFIDSSLIGGISKGNFYIFGDFEKQVLYQNDPKRIINTYLSNVPQFSLRVNCRNTPRIAEFVHLLGGLNPKYSRIRRPDNQIEPEIILYSTRIQQAKALSEKIKELTAKRRYIGKDIIILSPHSEKHCISRLIGGVVKPIYSRNSERDIGYCSIYSFKGLESPVIILTDIDDINSDQAKSLFYTAITRALDELIIFVNEKTRKSMLEIILTKN